MRHIHARSMESHLVLCRLRLRALSRPSRAVGSRGRHKPSLRPVTAHGSGFKSQKPEAAAFCDNGNIYIYQLINLIRTKNLLFSILKNSDIEKVVTRKTIEAQRHAETRPN